MDASDTESDNIAIGHAAMTANNAGGQYNIAVGNYAGDALTSGDNNVFMGHTAGGGTTSGDDNTFVGFAAGLVGSFIIGAFSKKK